eukprot:GHVU01114589.1.p1 GENE.GHVU01114589.1~~GHVU01114589.1.p1  ORF type:complete len:203 (-),score=17.85 GHVU01114589.1:1007-1615(-)
MSAEAKITKRNIRLPGGKLAFVLDYVYSKQECDDYIKLTETKGYEPAKVNVGRPGVDVLATDVRKSSRCIWDSFEETEKLWKKLEPHIPPTWNGRKVLGLNERMRFLRYAKKDYFKPHYDGNYVRDNGEKSYITVMVYLNEGFAGGTTTFIHPFGDNIEIIPQTGSVLVFQHDVFHEGAELINGQKYTIRTDVMYGPKQPKT